MKKVISLVLAFVVLISCFSISTSAASLRNLDLAFVIDTTGSMSDDIDVVKADMLSYLQQLNTTGVNYRIAIVDYRDFASRTGYSYDYPYKVQLDFTADEAVITEKINELSLGNGGDYEETVYSALINGLSELSWRSEAGKAVILMGDAPALDPEPITEYTLLDVYNTLRTGLVAPQTNVVASYVSKYNSYENSYFNKAATALDGSDGTPHMCVPGLAAGEYMVPQGLGYCEATNDVFVSSYYKKGTSGDEGVSSVIYSLDYQTGRLNGEYKIIDNAGNAFDGHVGGIAVSGNNVYVASEDFVHYIPLENFNKETGYATIKASYKVSEYMEGANCAYLTITDGVLWTGNFYDRDYDKYDTKASDEANSVVLGFDLNGYGNESEWNEFKNSEPDYTLYIDTSIEDIQCATVKDNRLYISQSFGRKNDSHLLFADITLDDSVTVDEDSVNSVTALPMMEGFFVKDNAIYTVFESATNFYMNNADGDGKSKNPTDVVWKIDCDRLTSVASRSAATPSYASEPVSEEAVIEAIGNVVVFAINTGYESDTTANFTEIAEATGGKYYEASESADVSVIIEEIINEIPEIVEDEEPVEPEEPELPEIPNLNNYFLSIIFDLIVDLFNLLISILPLPI